MMGFSMEAFGLRCMEAAQLTVNEADGPTIQQQAAELMWRRKLREVEVIHDGNDMFRSIAVTLGWEEDDHIQVRAQVVETMREIGMLDAPGREQNMHMQGVHGYDDVLFAASLTFGRRFEILVREPRGMQSVADDEVLLQIPCNRDLVEICTIVAREGCYHGTVREERMECVYHGYRVTLVMTENGWKVRRWRIDQAAWGTQETAHGHGAGGEGWGGAHQGGHSYAEGFVAVQNAGGSGKDMKEFMPAQAMVVSLGTTRAVVGFDTWAETTLVRRSRVDPGWEVVSCVATHLRGIGGDVAMGDRVAVPVTWRHKGEQTVVLARVMDDAAMPAGLDMLLGTSTQARLSVVIDAKYDRVEIRELGQVINTEGVWTLRARMEAEPLRVLDLCAGTSTAYSVFWDMGWNLKEWHAVEMDETARAVATAVYPEIEHKCDDIMEFVLEQEYDVVIAGPPCQPWSRAGRHRAKGYGDKRSEAFTAAARITREAVARNAGTAFMAENVCVAKHLQHEEQRQEDEFGAEFVVVNAADLGAPQRRPRRVASNILDLRELRKKPPVDPNSLLEVHGCVVESRVVPCVMASGPHTHSPLQVWDLKLHRNRDATPGEAAKLQGYQYDT
ncbi:MAG: DNA cytosine methyltransferase, partial [Pontimonas sp.]|nr:DNA cytosine methyltransferase [Pontimonas sp.]